MVRSVVAEVFPYDRVHDTYQEYYRGALKAGLQLKGQEYSESSNAYSDPLLRKLRAVRHSYRLREILRYKPVKAGLDALARLLSSGPTMGPQPAYGVYRFTLDNEQKIRVCIDANDFPDISEAAASCDIYFKSNFWPDRVYPSHVLPLPNMNPLVGRNLDQLRGLRVRPKTHDLFVFFRVWGGRDEVEGIEHNMAILEALKKVNCNAFLLAYLVAGDIPSLGKRLDDLGIAWTTKAMPQSELWEHAAAARLNLVRLGMHQCSPWRMIDILAMGGVPVVDYKPRTRWPQPMLEGEHYLNLNLLPGREEKTTDLTAKVAAWLESPSLIPSIARNNADYFDRYLMPDKLGISICETVESWVAGRMSPVSTGA